MIILMTFQRVQMVAEHTPVRGPQRFVTF